VKRRFSSQFIGMNSAIVYEGSAAYLIDPGVFPPELQRIRNFIEKENLVKVQLLLTHTHGDHISGWKTFGEFPIYVHRCMAEKSQQVRDNDVRYLQGMYRKQGYENFDQLAFPEHAILIDEGKFVSVEPYSFAFFHVPGHSVDMTSIIIPEERLMLSGDMLIQTPVPFILHSIRQYWDSLKRLKRLVLQYEIDCLIPGHGRPAKVQHEIISRIENEQKYVKELVHIGMNFLDQGMDDMNSKMQLDIHFSNWSQLHSHQSNVQTFLREYQDISIDDFADYEILNRN
jgi:hydroxyacylglutathione hydrolase